MIAVVDCDNFYVSCEKLFRPELNGRPAVVLSNNDGCIIARSIEAKALDVPMGAPLFMVRELLSEHNIAVFPSNFILYSDLSNRIMATLRNFSDTVEIYSIDEAFLELKHISDQDLETFGEEIRSKILQDIGLSVSVGIAPTKTLAKIASHYIKNDKKQFTKKFYAKNKYFPTHDELDSVRSGVQVLRDNLELSFRLQILPVEEVWGIGRNLTTRLHRHGITTCQQLIQASPRLIQQLMTIDGLRIQKELQCQVCREVNPQDSLPQSIMYSRSFPKFVTTHSQIQEIITRYADELAAKLRKHHLNASFITVYLTTKHHDPHPYTKVLSMNFDQPTSSSREIIKQVQALARQAFLPGFHYRKAGILVNGLIREGSIPSNIFEEISADVELIDVTLDQTKHRFGQNSVFVASRGVKTRSQQAKEKTRMLTRHSFTTKLSDILRVQ